MNNYELTKIFVDIFCILLLCSLAWMWCIGPIVDRWLGKRRERKSLEKRMEKNAKEYERI